MSSETVRNLIEAELSDPDRGWQYVIGGFATKLFMAGYVTAKNGVSAGFDTLLGVCEMNPYPAIGLMHVTLCNAFENTHKVAEFENMLRTRGLLHTLEHYHHVAEEWRQGVFSEWYMMCGAILAQKCVSTMRFGTVIKNASPAELVAMLYSFTVILKDEGLDIPTPEDVLAEAEKVLA